MEQMGAFMNTTSDLFDKSTKQKEKPVKKVVITNCQYRGCLKPLSPEKIRRHAEHCNKWCYAREQKLKKIDKRNRIQKEKEKRCLQFMQDHPEIENIIIDEVTRLVINGSRSISMRALFGYVLRMQHHIVINDMLTPYYVDYISLKYPWIEAQGRHFKTKDLFERRKKE